MPTLAHHGPSPASSNFSIVALASSAGGLKALTRLLAELPPDFPAAIVIVQHLDPNHPSLMAELLGRKMQMPIKQAAAGDVVRPMSALIAPPDRHILVNPDHTISLTQTELVHFVRPSADLLFESVAASFKERAIAIVLTGSGSDGSRGLAAIKRMGGTVIAQDQATSEFFAMPAAAIATGNVDHVLPLDRIPAQLVATLRK